MKLRLLDLFSGIGGFSLGLERSGAFETVAFCEIEPYCRRVLAKHWPDVRQYHDVRTLTAKALRRDGIAVDAICGGFPCQDISYAGRGAGIEGERSGLWSEYARLIGELRPRIVIVENVAALLGRGIERVLGDLAAFGYDAEWHCIRAADVGAPHLRDRLWIVAYPNRGGEHDVALDAEMAGASQFVANAQQSGEGRRGISGRGKDPEALGGWPSGQPVGASQDVADAAGRQWRDAQWQWPERHPWLVEPDVGRVAHGVPGRVDRLRALGNAVVPQIPELIGRCLSAAS
jgi:DNA (cytosine-5)-methyltransferase 1